MWSSKEGFELNIKPSSLVIVPDMMVLSLTLSLTLSFFENNIIYFHVKPLKKDFRKVHSFITKSFVLLVL